MVPDGRLADAADEDEIASLPLRSIFVTLIRHGQSADNVANIWAGHKDSPLTSTGLAQAKALGRAFADTHIDAIYASDLKRASQTAMELLHHNGTKPPPPLVQTQSLREQYFGQAEGRMADEIMAQKLAGALASDSSRSTPFPDGESLDQVNARLATAVRRFVLPRLESLRGRPKDLEASSHVCIVAHGIAIAELLRVFMALHDAHSNYGAPWDNPRASYRRVRLENTGWTRLQLSVPSAEAGPSALNRSKQRRQSQPAPSLRSEMGEALPSQAAEQSHTDAMSPRSDSVQLQANASIAQQPAEASSRNNPDGGSSQRPPRQDVFVRFVSHQNQIQHLSGLTGMLPSSALRDSRDLSGTDSALHLPPTPEKAMPLAPTLPASTSQKLSQYSASFMSRAMALGSAKFPLASGATTPANPVRGLADDSLSEKVMRQDVTAEDRGGSVPEVSQGQVMFSAPVPQASSTANSDEWQSVCAKVLALFDCSSTPNRIGGSAMAPTLSVEEVNDAVTNHIKSALERSPARASAALTTDVRNLLIHAMKRLSTSSGLMGQLSLSTSPDATYGARALNALASVWHAFFASSFHLVQALLLPLATDPILRSLATGSGVSTAAMMAATGGGSMSAISQQHIPGRETAGSAAASSTSLSFTSRIFPPSQMPFLPPLLPTQTVQPRQPVPSITSGARAGGAVNKPLLQLQRIDVRKLALSAFRDVLVLPCYEQLFVLFSSIGDIIQSVSGQSANASHLPRQREDGSRGSAALPSSQSEFRVLPATTDQLTQMTHILRSIHSGDEAQRAVDALVRALRTGMTGVQIDSEGWPSGNTPETKVHGLNDGPDTRNTNGLDVGLGLGIAASGAPTVGTFHSSRPGVSRLPNRSIATTGDRSTNRRGWIPRSAAKHGIHAAAAAAAQASTSSPQPSAFVARSRHLVAGATSEEAYLQALKATGRQEGDETWSSSETPGLSTDTTATGQAPLLASTTSSEAVTQSPDTSQTPNESRVSLALGGTEPQSTTDDGNSASKEPLPLSGTPSPQTPTSGPVSTGGYRSDPTLVDAAATNDNSTEESGEADDVGRTPVQQSRPHFEESSV
ncbi:unnamed protein product [Parajaminaea phylloscopi]